MFLCTFCYVAEAFKNKIIKLPDNEPVEEIVQKPMNEKPMIERPIIFEKDEKNRISFRANVALL